MRFRAFFAVSVALSPFPGFAPCASAQQTPPSAAKALSSSSAKVYTSDFFAPFAPVTALDIVRRVPGFQLFDSGNARGFGANAGNVLIDGRRPAVKSESLSALLARIPASSVMRVELRAVEGDAQGQGQVLDVVRIRGVRMTGTYAVTVASGERGGVDPDGRLALAFASDRSEYALSMEYSRQPETVSGEERFEDASGALLDRRAFAGRNTQDNYGLSASLKLRRGAAEIGLNTKLTQERMSFERRSDFFASDGILRGHEVVVDRGPSPRSGFELGGDAIFAPTDHTETQWLALYNRNRAHGVGRAFRFGHAQPTTSRETQNDDIEEEAILRWRSRWSSDGGMLLQFGAEGAYNRLRAEFSSRADGVEDRASERVDVAESRIEPFASFAWSAREKLRLEAGLVAERSRLRTRGASGGAHAFTYWKPRIEAAWTPNPASSLELRLERDVAQLEFGDFATSVDLAADGQIDAGNTSLRPQRTWTLSSDYRRTFLERGSVQLRASYVRISDTQDRVPLAVRDHGGDIVGYVDAPGNIGEGRRWNIELEFSLPIDRWLAAKGVGEMALTYSGHLHGSRVTDPTTGRQRQISSAEKTHQAIGFRHDAREIPLAWGADVEWGVGSTRYFFDQTHRSDHQPQASFFVEYTGFRAGKLKFSVENANETEEIRERIFYAGSRAGPPQRTAVRTQSYDPRVALTFAGKF